VDEDGPLDADELLDWLLEFEAELDENGMEDELLDGIALLEEAELEGGELEDEPDELEDADALAELEAGGWTPMCVRCGLRRLCGWRSCRFRSGLRSTFVALFCLRFFIHFSRKRAQRLQENPCAPCVLSRPLSEGDPGRQRTGKAGIGGGQKNVGQKHFRIFLSSIFLSAPFPFLFLFPLPSDL
jgi:hypothetical protein